MQASCRNPAITMASPALSFKFRVRRVHQDEQVEQPQHWRGNGFWKPPSTSPAIVIDRDTGWYIWSSGNVRRCPTAPQEIYQSSSVFYSHEIDAFYAVKYDCSRYNVSDLSGHGARWDWHRLEFLHQRSTDGCYSRIGHSYNQNVLGGVGNPAWFPQLLSERYRPTNPQHQTNTTFGGDLSLLVALAAFSISFEHIPWMMRNSFVPPNNPLGWHTHPIQIERRYSRLFFRVVTHCSR